MPPNTALEPTPVTPVSFRFGLTAFTVGVAQLLVVSPQHHTHYARENN